MTLSMGRYNSISRRDRIQLKLHSVPVRCTMLYQLGRWQQTNILLAYYGFWSPTQEYIAFLDFGLEVSVIYIFRNKPIRC
jgi:hypothetical protein